MAPALVMRYLPDLMPYADKTMDEIVALLAWPDEDESEAA
jgi:hypothetical protein